MKVLEEITFIILAGFAIYIWNKYAVSNLVKNVVRKNPKNNWLADNQSSMIKAFQSFYWVGYLMLITSVILSALKN
ncbi:MAG: hypothetical protein COA88_16000 [Kordia sp.]|nr:MAG: hypothetical protein COA88_16000 [Kordia sp.]